MVRDNRVKEVHVDLTAGAAGNAAAFTETPVNGLLYAVEVDMMTSSTADIIVYPSGHYGQQNFRLAFIQASGDFIRYPAATMQVNLTGTDALTTIQQPINDYVVVSGTNMGNGSSLVVRLLVI